VVAIDGAENAGLLAVQILSLRYPELRERMVAYKKNMEEEINRMDEEFQKEKK
jgi:5-(carboxyamino)imidazole ribonucleotide mutase